MTEQLLPTKEQILEGFLHGLRRALEFARCRPFDTASFALLAKESEIDQAHLITMVFAVSDMDVTIFQGRLRDDFDNSQVSIFIKRILHEVKTNPEFKKVTLEMLTRPKSTNIE